MIQVFSDLLHIFDSLTVPIADGGLGRFSARSIPGFSHCAVGKDINGSPALLVQANTESTIDPPVILENLSVVHMVSCRVQGSQFSDEPRSLTVIRCTGTDRILHEYFLRCLYPIAAVLPPKPSRQQINDSVSKLIDLFKQMAETPRKTVVGLWAELFVIAHAQEPTCLMMAWRSQLEERFDFALDSERLEVKCALGELRSHHFALEQLRPLGRTRVLIASLLTDRQEGGTSLVDLVELIRARVKEPSLLVRIDNIVARTLGQNWRAATSARFDLQKALASLRFVDAATLPAVSLPLPEEISGVHFRVDLARHPLPFPVELMNGALFPAAVGGLTRS
ncbi:MAG: PD-(D/E)XK motif protein [Myxococcales bacterium]|nr:PD-(D/E)XK motif protein [Myxococcales bacterium]